jgi:hypothetical protein
MSFENEWVEVEVERPLGWKVDNTVPVPLPIPTFLADNLDHQDCGEDCKRKKTFRLMRANNIELIFRA